MMRAACIHAFGPPGNIQITTSCDIPKIEIPEQILIKVSAGGVNPVDTYIRSGQYGVLPTLPYIPGRDGAGTVEEVGLAVKNLKKGEKVWFLSEKQGSAAEYIVTTRVFPLPEHISFTEGAALGVPYFTAYRALFLKGHLHVNSRILIHGASGGVGLAACQLAAWKGYDIVGTAGSPEGQENVKRNGARAVYNHREEGYVKKIKVNNPEGFDLILEMAAHINLAVDLDLLAKNGKVAIIGNRGEISINPRLLMMKESSIFGVTLAQSTQDEYFQMAAEINKMLVERSIHPVVHKEYQLDQISKAHEDIIGSAGTLGKLVVKL